MTTPHQNSAINDPGRLDVLRESGLLDTPSEECFDRLTRLAAKAIDAPIAMISLADQGQDVYKSAFGFERATVDRRGVTGETLCSRTLRSKGPMVVDDLQANPEYQNSPTVTNLGARAYLASPLNIRGAVIGAFCVIDTKSRQWSKNDIELIEQFGKSTVQEIELRLALRGAEQRRERVGTAKQSDDRACVLIADDDPAIRRLIVRALANDNYELIEARDGSETLEIMQERDVDVLLLDLMMPNLSGWDVLEKRARDERLRATPVIVVSARRGPDVARAVAYGIYGLVPKPFDAGDLRDLVKSCFTERRAGARAASAQPANY